MKTYPAKLLLFGEHTVNAGGQALAIPLPHFSGKWQRRTRLPGPQQRLPELADWLAGLQKQGELLADLDVAAFQKSLAAGVYFKSDIPPGYGAGSSGALVAAIFDTWKRSDFSRTDFAFLKKSLAQIESFYHGASSGADPLVCLLQSPLLLGAPGGDYVVEPPSSLDGFQFFLLDTGRERQATPFIRYFLEKMQGGDFNQRCNSELMPAVESAIQMFLAGSGGALFSAMHRIGSFQLEHLEQMVPADFQQMWRDGLDGDFFKLKVSGAGGGGFLLGLTKDVAQLRRWYPEQIFLPVHLKT